MSDDDAREAVGLQCGTMLLSIVLAVAANVAFALAPPDMMATGDGLAPDRFDGFATGVYAAFEHPGKVEDERKN